MDHDIRTSQTYRSCLNLLVGLLKRLEVQDGVLQCLQHVCDGADSRYAMMLAESIRGRLKCVEADAITIQAMKAVVRLLDAGIDDCDRELADALGLLQSLAASMFHAGKMSKTEEQSLHVLIRNMGAYGDSVLYRVLCQSLNSSVQPRLPQCQLQDESPGTSDKYADSDEMLKPRPVECMSIENEQQVFVASLDAGFVTEAQRDGSLEAEWAWELAIPELPYMQLDRDDSIVDVASLLRERRWRRWAMLGHLFACCVLLFLICLVPHRLNVSTIAAKAGGFALAGWRAWRIVQRGRESVGSFRNAA